MRVYVLVPVEFRTGSKLLTKHTVWYILNRSTLSDESDGRVSFGRASSYFFPSRWGLYESATR